MAEDRANEETAEWDGGTQVMPPSAPAEPELAWSRESRTVVDSDKRPWRRAWSRAALLVALADAVAAGIWLVGWAPPESAPKPEPPSESSPGAVPQHPELAGTDAKFIAEMRAYGVPVSDKDPGWTVSMARAVCDASHEKDYAPGMFTVNALIKGIMDLHPQWTRQQASRFTFAAIGYYCPDVRGPTQQEIADMPSDQRYLAMLQDQFGIRPTDGGDDLIRAAHEICLWRQRGFSILRIVEGIDSPVDNPDKRGIADAAIKVYCPEYEGG